ncbi:DNA internalization-related competence protein ComEC/Rec2 [Macrococcus carouselicus]|uniref:DNA internalization-related competence protein ComEC/Rec2 n=1 Tax=Macrococcus carouselicus TaxID=69969 RepID=A0A9Q8CK08_9STAP|nr:DNA internalization-related competence protein ComEC/Rec2 [Macrococcus carouselicus]TDM04394.1 DNA internalization-related competence protein ComEC/Rec2 [Macrococcus carouselicus]
MWFNIAVAALTGILFWQSPFSACILLIVITFHCVRKRKTGFLPLLILTGVFFLIYSYEAPAEPFDWTDAARGAVSGQLLFTDDLSVDGDLMNGTLTVYGQPVHFSYYLKSEEEQKRLLSDMPYYQSCTGRLELKQPLPNTNGLKFDYAAYLKRQGIHYMAEIKAIDFTACRSGNINLLEELKLYRVQLADRMMDTERFNIRYVVALTLGDTRYLTSSELEQLKALGIYHLYAISGSHVALISVQLFFLLKRLYVPVHWCTGVMLLLIPLYTVLTGLSPSVVRSSLFILIYMVMKKYGFTLLDSLSLSFLLFLLVDVSVLSDIGFQLSYFISFTLVVTSDLLQDKRPLTLLIITSLISQLASLPVLIMNFNSFQVIGFLTNLVFIPFFTFLMFPLCTIILLWSMLFHTIPLFFDSLLHAAFFINDIMISLFKLIRLPDIIVADQLAEGYVLLIAVVYASFLMLKKSLLHFYTAIAVTLLLVTGLTILQPRAEGVTFIDVGQGDSSLVESQGQVMVTDTGGKADIPKEKWRERRKGSDAISFNVLALLHEKGYSRIDFLLLTHPDADHFGEAVHLMERMHVDNLILNTAAPGHEKYQSLLVLAHKKGTQVIDARTVEHFKVGHADVKLMNTEGTFSDENDSSIVSRVTLGRRYLLMGDLPIGKEELLKEKLCEEPADILKVGHHGSHTSTSDALLDCLKPKYAVISAGRNNRFGHPHVEVVERLATSHIQVFNTQVEGRIEFSDEIRTAKRP